MNIPDGKYLKGYKVKIYPTAEQATFIDRCIELNRYVYNWALGKQNEQYGLYKDGLSEKRILSRYDLDKLFTSLREEKPWLKEIPHNSGRSAIRRVDNAFKYLFKGCARKPKFKSKKKEVKHSYTTRADRMFFEDNMLRIEGLPLGDKIKTKFHTGFSKNDKLKFYNTVVSRDNRGFYYISFKMMEDKPSQNYFELKNIPKMDRAIGIDLNYDKRFALSTGDNFKAPDMSKQFRKLKRINRKTQKDRDRLYKLKKSNSDTIDIPISNRALKRIDSRRKIYKKIHNITENFIQTTTKKIIDMNPQAIVMEKLNIKSMMKKHKVASYMHHTCLFRCREVMQYKCNMYDIPFILAPYSFKSTKTCSMCGTINNVRGRTYKCSKCGLIIDRDFNASLNLENLAYI